MLLAVQLPAADDRSRLEALENIPARQWEQIRSGDAPWPECFFPISTWSASERKQFKPAYWQRIESIERSWPNYIAQQRQLFKAEYGEGIHNLYDLFRAERSRDVAATEPVREIKTLQRLMDLAALKADDFTSIRGRNIAAIRLYAHRMGRIRAIPHDIIEFTPKNLIVLPQGPEANPADGDGLFNNTDRLFFMAADAGDHVDPAWLGQEIGAAVVEEIELAHAGDGERGWVYAVAFGDEIPAGAPFDYIRFHPDAAIVFTPFVLNQCTSSMIKKKIHSTMGVRTWATTPAMGGFPFDIHERLHINSRIAFKIGTKKEDEDDFNLAWRAWYDGNVVFYTRVSWRMSTPLGIGAPTVLADILATPLSLFCYPGFHTPFDPSLLVRLVDFSIGEQLNDRIPTLAKDFPLLQNTRLLTSRDREGMLIDAGMSEKEKALDGKQSAWLLLTSPCASICIRNSYDEFLTKHAALNLDWQDNPETVGTYRNALCLESFKNRQQHFFVEWNVVPWFWNADAGRYQWDNLDLVLRHRDRPLSYRIGDTKDILVPRNIHVPDIGTAMERHRY